MTVNLLPINVISNLTELEKGALLIKLIKEVALGKAYKELADSRKIGSFIKEQEHYDDYSEDAKRVKQNEQYHKFFVPYHVLEVILSGEKHHPGNIVINLACLLHDTGKGLKGIRDTNKKGEPNDIGHEKAGIQPAKELFVRFGFMKEEGKETPKEVQEMGNLLSQEVIDDVLFLIEQHGLTIAQTDLSLTPQEAVDKFKDGSARKAIKKLVPYVKSKTKEELKDKLKLLFNFKKLDAMGFQTDEALGNFSKRQLDIIEIAYPRYMAFVDKEDFFSTN